MKPHEFLPDISRHAVEWRKARRAAATETLLCERQPCVCAATRLRRPSAPPEYRIWDSAHGVWRDEAGAARPALSVLERRNQQQQERRKAAASQRDRDASQERRQSAAAETRRACGPMPQVSQSPARTPWLVPKTGVHADGDRFQSNAGRVCVPKLVRSEGVQVDRADAAAPASHSTERAAQGRMLKAWVFTQALIPTS